MKIGQVWTSFSTCEPPEGEPVVVLWPSPDNCDDCPAGSAWCHATCGTWTADGLDCADERDAGAYTQAMMRAHGVWARVADLAMAAIDDGHAFGYPLVFEGTRAR